MVRKRLIYIIEDMIFNMEKYSTCIKEQNPEALLELKREVPASFAAIDFVYGHVLDISKERFKPKTMKNYLDVVSEIRVCNHYLMDLVLDSLSNSKNRQIADEIIVISEILKDMKERIENKISVVEVNQHHGLSDANLEKMYESVVAISQMLNRQSAVS